LIVATLVPLQAAILALVAVVAPLVVLSRDPLKMVVVNGIYNWALVVLFVVFGAPDVALSMLVVGAVGYPLVLLVAIARSRKKTQ
jgi:energy-converting hydrogenase B subunit D